MLWVLFIELILMWSEAFSGGIMVPDDSKCRDFTFGVLASLGQRALLQGPDDHINHCLGHHISSRLDVSNNHPNSSTLPQHAAKPPQSLRNQSSEATSFLSRDIFTMPHSRLLLFWPIPTIPTFVRLLPIQTSTSMDLDEYSVKSRTPEMSANSRS